MQWCPLCRHSRLLLGWSLQSCLVIHVIWPGPGRIIAACQMCCGTCRPSWLGRSQRRCPANPWHGRCMSSCRYPIVHAAPIYNKPPLLFCTVSICNELNNFLLEGSPYHASMFFLAWATDFIFRKILSRPIFEVIIESSSLGCLHVAE